MSRLSIAVTVLWLGYCEVAVGSQMFLYWTEDGSGKIERSNLDGSHVTDIVTGLNHPAGIAIDATNGKLYWTTHEGGNGSGTLQRANLDGSGRQTVLSALGAPEGVAIDPTAGFAYYTDRSDAPLSPNDRGIHRVNLDGTGKTLLLSTRNGPNDPSNPIDIALDLSAGKMYWTDDGPDSLSRANLDGTAYQRSMVGTTFGTSGLGLDVALNHAFWTNSGTHEIRRSNLDGTSNIQILSGLGDAVGLALDLSAGKMYWTEYNGGKIRVAGLDGSGVQDVAFANHPDGIAIGVPEPASWILAIAGICCLVAIGKAQRVRKARI